jgi:hypothetical protein
MEDTHNIAVFSINGTKLSELREQQFPLEREIQRLTEANMDDLFDHCFHLLMTEYKIVIIQSSQNLFTKCSFT